MKKRIKIEKNNKLSQHIPILMTAVFFDILGLIPFLCIVFNFIFGAILWIYFSGRGHSGLTLKRIILPIAAGSIIDSIISILPVNIGTTLYRIKAH